MIPVSKIKETCLYVADLQKTRYFYHEKLGLPLISLVENSHVFFRAGTSVLLCFLSERSAVQTTLPVHFGKGQIHFAFEVESKDYEKCKVRILELEIKIEQEQKWPNNKLSFYFRDPDNHLVEIVEVGLWD